MQETLQKEAKVVQQYSFVVMNRILTPVQAAVLLADAWPSYCDTLAFTHALTVQVQLMETFQSIVLSLEWQMGLTSMQQVDVKKLHLADGGYQGQTGNPAMPHALHTWGLCLGYVPCQEKNEL